MLENEALNNTPEEDTTIEQQDDTTSVEEIEIEEMAIDGICGVY
jgi:mycofactocin precursor